MTFQGQSVAPFGLEAKITFNGLTLNDKSLADTYMLTDIGGLDDADIRDARDPYPDRHGENAYRAFYGGRTITLTGYIRASNLRVLRQMQSDLRKAFGQALIEKSLIFSIDDSTKDVFVNCRKSAALSMRETQPDVRMRRDFLVTLRASDPRFLSLTTTTTTILSGNTATLVNLGNWSEYPILAFTGPLTAPITVTNQTTGVSFILSGSIPSGEIWTATGPGRTLNNGSSNKFSDLDPNSLWLTLEPGSNVIALTSGGSSGAAQLAVTYRNAWM